MLGPVTVFFLLVAFSSAEENDNEIVDKVLAGFNKYIQENSLVYFPLSDFKINSFLTSLSSRNGQLGKFSTIRRQTNSNLMKEGDKVDYQVTVGLGELSMRLDFDGMFFRFIKSSGRARISVDVNSFLLMGSIFNASSPEDCLAKWEHIVTMEFGNAKVDIQPASLYHSFLSLGLQYLINSARPFYIPQITLGIEEEMKAFIPNEIFSSVVCKHFSL